MSISVTTYDTTIVEGYGEVPRQIKTLCTESSFPITRFSKDLITTNDAGVNMVPYEITDRTITLLSVDLEVFTVGSKYLGNNLFDAINSLNIKNLPNEYRSLLNISGNFYQMNETPWRAFIRLSKLIPKGYLIVCCSDKMRLVSTSPNVVHTYTGNRFAVKANYKTGMISDPVSAGRSCENPRFIDRCSIPFTKQARDNYDTLVGDPKLVENYFNDKIDRFKELTVTITGREGYDIGDGIVVGENTYVIISRTISISNTGDVGATYICSIL